MEDWIMFFLCVSVFHIACYYILSGSADRLVVGEGIYVHKNVGNLCKAFVMWGSLRQNVRLETTSSGQHSVVKLIFRIETGHNMTYMIFSKAVFVIWLWTPHIRGVLKEAISMDNNC